MRTILLSAAVVAASLVPGSTPSIHASSPCDDVIDAAKPGPPTPWDSVGGSVFNTPTVDGVGGATASLFFCDGSSPVLVDTDLTAGDGSYSLDAGSGAGYYFVSISAPGYISSPGTLNPSALVGLGLSVDDINFWVE